MNRVTGQGHEFRVDRGGQNCIDCGLPRHDIRLGDKARDIVTGYEGIVVAETTWLNNCRRLTLQQEGVKDGKVYETYTDDEMQMELIAIDPLEMLVLEDQSGGPRPDPVRPPNVG